MEKRKTLRGFKIIEFEDLYGIQCSLQESSLATDNAIWLGCQEANPKKLVKGEGWQPVNIPEDVQCTTRMHLNCEQVKELLPHLQKFVDEGEL